MRQGLGSITAIVAILLAGCFTPSEGDDPADPDRSGALLPPGTSMPDARIIHETPSSITFLWEASTEPSVEPESAPGTPVETRLVLPSGVPLEVVSQRRPVLDEGFVHSYAGVVPVAEQRLATTVFDADGSRRCGGRGPGLGSDWRETCRVRPAGPFVEPSEWLVRVAQVAEETPATGTAIPDRGAAISFGLELTVRALPPTPIFSLGEMQVFEADASDGVALRGHVYLPDGPGPFATILVYQPYWNKGGSLDSDSLEVSYDGRRTIVRPWGTFLDAGFAIAAVNVRGSGLSDGCYEYMNHPRNGPDANVVVDAIATQPWSNGRVGMYGVSYPAATQFAAIANDPSPHLAAVMPMSGEWDEWNFLAIWGASYIGAESHPTRRNADQGLGAARVLDDADDGTVTSPTPEHWCEDTATSQANWNDLILSGDKTPWLQARDLREGIRESRVPIFMTNGITDGEGAHRSTPYDLWELVDAPQRWLLGQYPHCPPGCDDVGFAWDTAIPWFDHYLRDGPPVAMGKVDYQDDSGAWHAAERWPPPGAQKLLYLSSDRRLVDAQAGSAPSTQRAVNRDGTVARPGDCDTTALFVSAPFDQDVLVAGEFLVNFTASSTTPNGNVAAYLYRSPNAPACGATDPAAHLIRYALSDLRHRGHLEQGTDVTPGQTFTMSMRSYPFAARVTAGEHLVLVIASGHPDLTPKPYQPILTVATGGQPAGTLSLTIVEEFS